MATGRTLLSTLTVIGTLLLAFVLAYTLVSKLLNFEHYSRAMLSQPWPGWAGHALIFAVPVAEATGLTMLFTRGARQTGCWLTAGVMAVFTAYVVWIKVTGLEGSTCPCGGLFSRLSWNQHLWVNASLTLIAVLCALGARQQQRIFHGREKQGKPMP